MKKRKPELRQIPVEQLSRGQYQPRREFDPDQLAELATSIQSAGLLQPIIVRPLGENAYEIIAGERRWRAARLAGLDQVDCLVNYFSDEQAAEAATIENVNRVDLNPIEEARAYQRMIDEFDYLHEEVAAAVGKSRTKITNLVRLLKLDERVQNHLIAKKISEGHGKALAAISQAHQYLLAQKIVARGWSVRKLEQEIKKLQHDASRDQRQHDPNLARLETVLSDHIGCQTHIDFDSQEIKGQLKIDFQNLDILQGLLEKMGLKTDEMV